MEIQLNTKVAENYKSNAQKTHVITEFWVKHNGYCPNCGCELNKFENNRPVADFFCNNCKEEFELKSKNSKNIGEKIVDGGFTAGKIEFNDKPFKKTGTKENE